MNTITIPRIDIHTPEASEVGSILDKAAVKTCPIANVNWPDIAPYAPEVSFRIAHTGSSILIEYKVSEESIRALAPDDNGPVWEDSCVEFFIAFRPDNYYNIECNCGGTLLCGAGEGREGRVHAEKSLIASAKRHSSIGKKHFDTEVAPDVWTLALVIPVELFFRDNITDLSGVKARGNFYKCGDMLPQPHFLSWKAVEVPTPNFHLPEFFGELIFEK